jgi:hypothetical protein
MFFGVTASSLANKTPDQARRNLRRFGAHGTPSACAQNC